MDGLIELIFESVSDDAVESLLNDLLQGAEVLELSHSELGSLDPTARQDLTQLINRTPEPSSITIHAASAKIADIRIRNPSLRVLRVESSNELAIFFSSTNIEAKDQTQLIIHLAKGAKELANRTDVPHYYCGFEPATDERTQLFSGSRIGPIVSI
jgi:hypothetical protein